MLILSFYLVKVHNYFLFKYWQEGEERGEIFFYKCHGKQHDARKGEGIRQSNLMPNLVLGVWIKWFNGQNKIVWSGNSYCSSIKVASIDENKNSHRKITTTHTLTTCLNHIALRSGKKGHVLLKLDPGFSVRKISFRAQTKQNWLKCKHTIQITTFNVRTLNRIRQLLELTALALDHNKDIIRIQEHIYTHSEYIKYHENGNGWTLATSYAWKKLCQCHIRRCRYAYRTTSPKITK